MFFFKFKTLWVFKLLQKGLNSLLSKLKKNLKSVNSLKKTFPQNKNKNPFKVKLSFSLESEFSFYSFVTRFCPAGGSGGGTGRVSLGVRKGWISSTWSAMTPPPPGHCPGCQRWTCSTNHTPPPTMAAIIPRIPWDDERTLRFYN